MTRLWAVFVALAAAAGCGRDDPTRAHVAGRVTVGDIPVASGRITFDADRSRGHRGVQGYAVIAGGRFDTRATGRAGPSGPVKAVVSGHGPPSEKFPGGVPLVWEHETPLDLPPGRNERDIAIPASARIPDHTPQAAQP